MSKERREKQRKGIDRYIDAWVRTNSPDDENHFKEVQDELRALWAREKLLEAVVQKRRCSDGGCIWGPPSGMHTNGGCQHLKLNPREARSELKCASCKQGPGEYRRKNG